MRWDKLRINRSTEQMRWSSCRLETKILKIGSRIISSNPSNSVLSTSPPTISHKDYSSPTKIHPTISTPISPTTSTLYHTNNILSIYSPSSSSATLKPNQSTPKEPPTDRPSFQEPTSTTSAADGWEEGSIVVHMLLIALRLSMWSKSANKIGSMFTLTYSWEDRFLCCGARLPVSKSNQAQESTKIRTWMPNCSNSICRDNRICREMYISLIYWADRM